MRLFDFLKNIILLSSITFLCATTPLDKSKVIIRRWILVDIQTPSMEKNFEKRGIRDYKRTKMMQQLVAGSYINFKSNGTYEASILGSKPESLYWNLSDNDDFLLVRKKPEIHPQHVAIEELSKKSLVILLPERKGEQTRLFFIPDPKTDLIEEGK